MVSRDTAVQITAVLVAILLAGLSQQFGGTTPLLLGAGAYIVVFAGSHVYLALRGDGEAVPTSARWRFTALVVVAVTAVALGFAYGTATVAGTSLSTLLGLGVAALFVAYWLYEARDGYRASRQA